MLFKNPAGGLLCTDFYSLPPPQVILVFSLKPLLFQAVSYLLNYTLLTSSFTGIFLYPQYSFIYSLIHSMLNHSLTHLLLLNSLNHSINLNWKICLCALYLPAYSTSPLACMYKVHIKRSGPKWKSCILTPTYSFCSAPHVDTLLVSSGYSGQKFWAFPSLLYFIFPLTISI